MACVGSVQEMKLPAEVYVAGMEGEGITTLATAGNELYLNGPGIYLLKAGSVQRVVRPQGKVHDPRTNAVLGIYYKDIGKVQIEAVTQESASARTLLSCEGLLKGDLVLPDKPKPIVEFNGSLSNPLTSVPRGLSSSILLAKDDARQLAAGQFCFIRLGNRDGIKPGDRFIVFRRQPAFNRRDMAIAGTGADAAYSPMHSWFFRSKMDRRLSRRTIPPKVLGDIVIVDVSEGTATGKIINSMSEIVPGDRVVKK